MNKKFLSAILFGALMATSAGTFVSCKDYDDDIENLQGQIDKNSSAIAELQKLVGAGNWVTSISPVTGGFTVTMSNGQSQTITGINGADGKDGKNGTEWTIGEDGFWYMDGEKTDNVAIGKNGENGVTAPSPSIGADGNWVVYNWDAEKGEFVAEATEIPAQGTAAYAVEANGVITLHIADANGEYMEIALPSTCDSFVVEAPFKDVEVIFEKAEWTAWAAASRTEAGKALLAKYPELADIKKGAAMKQGGVLPLIVTPAAVELTDEFSFTLQTADGKVADIALSNPTKGVEGLSWGVDKLVSRSAEDACLWSLDVEPAYNAKNKTYAGTYRSSLIVANEKGTAVRTAFAYTVGSTTINEAVDIMGNKTFGSTTMWGSDAPYAESIDLFAPIYNADGTTTNAPVRFKNEYKGHYIILVNDALQAEKYGLSMAEDGHTLNIAKMPETELSITVELKVIALGLNGSVKTNTINLTIGQEIAAAGELADKEVTLGYTAKDGYNKYVRWNIADLGFTATQLDQFLKATAKNYTASYTDEEGNEKKVTGTWAAYDKNGSSTTSYKNAVTFGFTVNSQNWIPQVYALRLTAANGNTVIYAADAALTVVNPTATAIKLVPEFVDENGVLQIVGALSSGKIVYNLDNGVILGDQIETVKYEDVDYVDYEEANGAVYDEYEMASYNWMADAKTLSVFPYNATSAATEPAKYAQLETVRNIRATYKLFGNVNNTETFDFKAIVKSAVWSATPTDVVTITKTALELPLVDNTNDGVDQTTVNIAKITSAVLAYGPNAGKVYNLWNTPKQDAYETTKNHNILSKWNKVEGTTTDYVANADGLMVEIALADLDDFGYDSDYIIDAQAKGTKTYIMSYANVGVADHILTWSKIWSAIKDLGSSVEVKDGVYEYQKLFVDVEAQTSTEANPVYVNSGVVVKFNTAVYNALMAQTGPFYTTGMNKTTQKYLSLYKKYYESIAYEQYVEEYEVAEVPAGGRSAYLTEDATIVFADAKTGDNFVNLSGTSITASLAAGVDMTTDTVDVPFYLVIKDVWGKTMKVPFTVTVKK